MGRFVMLATFVLAPALAAAQGLTAAPAETPPPDDLAPAIKTLLTASAVKVTSGATTLEFWWVQSLDASGSGKGWERLAEGALVGAVRVSNPYPDIRGKRIKPGVYTLRYGLQPMNGDHLGVSPFREFLLVSPASADTAPAPVGHQGAVDLSKQTIGASHPAVWSIDPPVAEGQPLTSYTSDEGHQGIVFDVATRGGAMKFGLILIGKIEA